MRVLGVLGITRNFGRGKQRHTQKQISGPASLTFISNRNNTKQWAGMSGIARFLAVFTLWVHFSLYPCRQSWGSELWIWRWWVFLLGSQQLGRLGSSLLCLCRAAGTHSQGSSNTYLLGLASPGYSKVGVFGGLLPSFLFALVCKSVALATRLCTSQTNEQLIRDADLGASSGCGSSLPHSIAYLSCRCPLRKEGRKEVSAWMEESTRDVLAVTWN